MAVLAGALTLADWAKRVDDQGKIAYIVEILSQNNDILQDMTVTEGNLVTGHRTTLRTGLPSATWRLLNAGVIPSKSTTAPIDFACGNLEAQSRIDRDVAALNGNTAAFRLSEVQAFIQGMGQTMASTLFYGNQAVNPERFTGLSAYYSTVTSATAQTALNVIDAGGTGSDNTSIWIVNWGPRAIHGIFPKGKTTGLRHEDKGEWQMGDATNGYYWALVDHFKWELGLAVEDWRYAVRIANIDVSDLSGTTGANLINLLVRAVHRLPTTGGMAAPVTTSDAPSISGSMGSTAIYMNRTIASYLDQQAMNKTNVWLGLVQWHGMTLPGFRGIPFRNADALLNTEARVT